MWSHCQIDQDNCKEIRKRTLFKKAQLTSFLSVTEKKKKGGRKLQKHKQHALSLQISIPIRKEPLCLHILEYLF